MTPSPWYTLGEHDRYTLADYGWYGLGDSRWYSIARLLTDMPQARKPKGGRGGGRQPRPPHADRSQGRPERSL